MSTPPSPKSAVTKLKEEYTNVKINLKKYEQTKNPYLFIISNALHCLSFHCIQLDRTNINAKLV